MKLSRFWIRLAVALLIVFSVFGLSTAASLPGKDNDPGSGILTLKAPAFLNVAHAQMGPQSIGAFLDDEAGISAYFKVGGPIDLSMARVAFRTIEAETPDYLIGSVVLQDYLEGDDVHVYVHKDGWFLAYYLKADPASKIIDWFAYTPGTIPSKLENALAKVAGQAGVATVPATYYDFRNPNATHMMLIAATHTNLDGFNVNLTGNYTYLERSWSAGNPRSPWGVTYWYLDGTLIGRNPQGHPNEQGALTQAQLAVNAFHNVKVTSTYIGYGGLALIYRVQ